MLGSRNYGMWRLRQLAAQAELLTGKETPGEALQQTLKTVMVEDI